jgi:general secretion pathway protein E
MLRVASAGIGRGPGAVTRGFVDFLIERGTLAAAQRERVLTLRGERGESEALIVTRLGLAPERAVASLLAEHLGLPLVDPGDYPASPVLPDLIAPSFLARSRVVPLRHGPDGLVLAMADPTDEHVIEAIRLVFDGQLRPCVAIPSEVEAAVARLYGAGSLAPAAPQAEASAADLRRLADSASEEPVIRYVNGLIHRAATARASDIHIEAEEERVRQRLRIDGVLREIEPPPPRLHANVISRLKIMAGVNIAERRLPQDGRFRAIVEGREIDIRVSMVPTLHGESAVLRLLDRVRAPLELPELGFSPTLDSALVRLLDLPNGILLVTGPTGSGKTSTLYAALQRLNSAERKILTVEDPVEYQLPGINQISVKPAIGLTFATLLRSLLRQDPDIILVGEIRDVETARIAVQASLTGHLVLSTVHTNDAPSTVARLLDMGLEPYLLTSVLRGVLGQRLVRRLCPVCRAEYAPVPEIAALLAESGAGPRPDRLWRPVGCATCGGTGYLGRTVVAELLVPDDAIHRLTLAGADASTIAKAALERGMEPMRLDALRKAAAGVTSLDEVFRVTGAA